jgi:hypothetical protein
MNMVSADFVVIAAGDDVSETNRTSESTRVWLESDRRALSIFSSVMDIDIDGNQLGISRRVASLEQLNDLDRYASGDCSVLGASHCWDMRLFREFGPLLTNVVSEDVVLAARAALIGSVKFLDMPLVRYRQGAGLSFMYLRRRKRNIHENSISTRKAKYYNYLQLSRDFKLAGAFKGRESIFARSRATALYPIWLRIGRRTRSRVFLFFKRCDSKFLVWEWIKYRFPALVAFKHKVNDYWRKKSEIVRV